MGDKTKEDIERGCREKEGTKRLSAIDFPETKPWKSIHGIKNINNFLATAHDRYHTIVMSTIPKQIRQGILEFANILRADTKQEWSHEIWQLIDCEFLYFFQLSKLLETTVGYTKFSMTYLFCNILFSSNLHGKTDLLTNSQNNLTVSGIILLLDMVTNPEKWKTMGLHFDKLSKLHPIKTYYDQIKSIHHNIKDEPKNIQILKILLSFNLLPKKQGHKQFDLISKLISAHQEIILQQFEFKKIKGIDKKQQKKLALSAHSIYPLFANKAIHLDPTQNNDMVAAVLETIGAQFGTEINPVHFKELILNAAFNKKELDTYINFKKQGFSDLEAQYCTKPTVWVRILLICSSKTTAYRKHLGETLQTKPRDSSHKQIAKGRIGRRPLRISIPANEPKFIDATEASTSTHLKSPVQHSVFAGKIVKGKVSSPLLYAKHKISYRV